MKPSQVQESSKPAPVQKGLLNTLQGMVDEAEFNADADEIWAEIAGNEPAGPEPAGGRPGASQSG